MLVLFLLLLRIVNSPFGRVLQAIRENDFRAEAIGYRTVVYRTLSNVLAALFATLAGALLALSLRYAGPDTTLSFEIMLDILLIVVIGGMGTMYGAVIGAVLFVLAQTYLQDLLARGRHGGAGRAAAAGPDRARPLAAVAGRAVRAVGLPLSHRRRRPAARLGAGAEGEAIDERRHVELPASAKGARSTTPSGVRSTPRSWSPGTAWRAPGATWTPSPRRLSHRWRVICPDTLGRGLSQWSPDPRAEYCLAFYEKLAVSLLDQLGVAHCLWLGTSMGGAIGLKAGGGYAARAHPAPGAQRHRPATGRTPRCSASAPTPAARRPSPPWASWKPSSAPSTRPTAGCSDAQWRQLTETSMRRLPDGRVTPHYDPAMVQQFEHHPDDYLQWDAWDTLELPVLCLRGESSDLLLPETAEAMRARGPRAVVVTIPGCGHAPALNTPEQFALVERFFAGA